MPLRALLLLPSGEQPTTTKPSSSKPTRTNAKTKPSNLTIPSSTIRDALTSPFTRSFSPAPSGQSVVVDTDAEEDIRDEDFSRKDLGWPFDSDTKPLPSPPRSPLVLDKDLPPLERDNRGSNQTYQTSLTLPSISGSSRSGTDVNTPPESPSPTSTVPRIHTTDDNGTDVKPLVLGTKLKRDVRGRPILSLNTKLPRIGSALTYRLDPTAQPVEDDSSDEEYSDDDDEENRDGERTAREAVDQRLNHLMITTSDSTLKEKGKSLLPPPSPSYSRTPSFSGRSPTRLSLAIPLSQSPTGMHSSPLTSRPGSKVLDDRPSSKILSVLGEKLGRLSTLSARPTSPLPSSLKNLHHPGKRKRVRRSRHRGHDRSQQHVPTNPPPPPIKGLPPFKILSDNDMLDLLGDLNVYMEGKRVGFGWERKDLSRLERKSYPKGTRGRYIRLVTHAQAPPTFNVDEDDLLSDAGTKRLRGVVPKVLIDDDAEKTSGMEEEKEVFTVFMNEHIEAWCPNPVGCLMYPRLPSPNSTLTSTIHTLPQHAYLHPLPHLTRLQHATLQKVGLLVYAVPRDYYGTVPPHVEFEEELVGPWARPSRNNTVDSVRSGGRGNRDSTSTLGDGVVSPVKSGMMSPLRNGFGIAGPVSPLRLGFGSFRSNLNGEGVNDVPSGFGSRLGVEGLWSKRSSAMSIVEVTEEPESESVDKTPTSTVDSTGGWSSTLGSLRSKAQVYYASRATTPVKSPLASPSPSAHSALPEEEATRPLQLTSKEPNEEYFDKDSSQGSNSASGSSQGSATSSNSSSVGVAASRSLGSFFSRGTSALSSSLARSTSASTLSTQNNSAMPTPSEDPLAALDALSKEAESAMDALREEGIVVKNLDGEEAGEVLFDFSTLKGGKTAPAPAPVVQVQTQVESKGSEGGRWKWKGRWGS